MFTDGVGLFAGDAPGTKGKKIFFAWRGIRESGIGVPNLSHKAAMTLSISLLREFQRACKRLAYGRLPAVHAVPVHLLVAAALRNRVSSIVR